MSWQFARRNSKIFVYRNGGMTPSLIFQQSERGFIEGYGLRFAAFDKLVKFVEREGDFLIKSSSCKSDSFA